MLLMSASPLSAVTAASSLTGISPGTFSVKHALTTNIDGRCPTFSWASPATEGQVKLAVFEISAPASFDADQAAVATEPVLEELLPAGAISWTPPLNRCLQRGWLYAWAVRFMTDEPSGEWSEPMFFQTGSRPSLAEVRAALGILQSSKLMTSRDADPGAPRHAGSPESTTESTLSGPFPASALAPGTVAVSAAPAETVGVVVGALGISDSTGTGSAGLVGESDAASGNVIGILGVSASAGGAAGVFENTAGGTILAGYGNGTLVFDVDGNGTFTAVKFNGLGTGITDLGDINCNADFVTNFGCITGSTEIAGLTISNDDLADGSVREDEIKEGAVHASEISAGAVTSLKIASGAAGASEIASNAIDSSKIKASAVTSRVIADGAVGTFDLAANSIKPSQFDGDFTTLYEVSSGCDNPGDLTFAHNCPSSDCGVSQFKNCGGTCNQVTSLTCSNTDIGTLLGPTMPN